MPKKYSKQCMVEGDDANNSLGFAIQQLIVDVF